jgi:hypothetical protein
MRKKPPVRNAENDKVFPLESTRISEFEFRHDKSVPAVFIHDGYFADEFARSMNAQALTVGTDIYFRKNAYNPGSEEGRRLLAHELTHVAQYTEKRITRNASKEELENEALAAESKEEPAGDKMMCVEIGGERFRFRESQMKKIAEMAARETVEWVRQLKDTLPETEYLSCLCAVIDKVTGAIF